MENNLENKAIEKPREYLCKCTECNTIYLDNNPGDQKKSNLEKAGIIKELSEFVDDDGNIYRGCGKCKTDGFLIDVELKEN